MKTRYYCCLISVFAVFFSCGNGSVESRRQNDLKEIQQKFGHARNPIGQAWGTNILSALSSANETTLKRPRFATATMGRDASGEYRLFVFWLQDSPSVDAVEIHWGKSGSTMVVDLLKDNTAENAKRSHDTVTMSASWIWPTKDTIWSKLENIDDVSSLRVRLLESGKPATDWYPILFYRLDHWMGSKEITDVTNGPPNKASK